MSGEDDDEALTWAGGRDPSHYETPEAKPQKPARDPKPVTVGRTATSVADSALTDDDEILPPAMSGIVLICLGVLGGIYALYTVGWIVSLQRLSYTPTDALELVAFQVQQVLAIVAPPLWFAVTLILTRGRKSTVRLLWLVIGALALVPWSFTLGR